MDVSFVNKDRIPNIDNLLNVGGLSIDKVVRTEERMCYDSHWDVYTNFGVVELKLYDGWREKDLLDKCRRCGTLRQLLDIQPKYFYYD